MDVRDERDGVPSDETNLAISGRDQRAGNSNAPGNNAQTKEGNRYARTTASLQIRIQDFARVG